VENILYTFNTGGRWCHTPFYVFRPQSPALSATLSQTLGNCSCCLLAHTHTASWGGELDSNIPKTMFFILSFKCQ
jgi:hypothetical protein